MWRRVVHLGFCGVGRVALASSTLAEWLAQRPRWTFWQERLAGTVVIALGLRMFFAITDRGR
jgi:threonine/homoserine/homoserine lactone efflux protein